MDSSEPLTAATFRYYFIVLFGLVIAGASAYLLSKALQRSGFFRRSWIPQAWTGRIRVGTNRSFPLDSDDYSTCDARPGHSRNMNSRKVSSPIKLHHELESPPPDIEAQSSPERQSSAQWAVGLLRRIRSIQSRTSAGHGPEVSLRQSNLPTPTPLPVFNLVVTRAAVAIVEHRLPPVASDSEMDITDILSMYTSSESFVSLDVLETPRMSGEDTLPQVAIASPHQSELVHSQAHIVGLPLHLIISQLSAVKPDVPGSGLSPNFAEILYPTVPPYDARAQSKLAARPGPGHQSAARHVDFSPSVSERVLDASDLSAVPQRSVATHSE